MKRNRFADGSRERARRRRSSWTDEARHSHVLPVLSVWKFKSLSSKLPFPRKLSMVRRMGVREQGLAAKLEALRTTFLRNDAVRFVMVGSLGFAIDAAILAGLVQGALARAVAMTTAVLCSWLIHRQWTFASGRARPPILQS